MRVTITGKTKSTIAFNTLGITLRGNVVVRNIDIKNDEQLREVISMKNAGLIELTRDDVAPPTQPTKSTQEEPKPQGAPKFVQPKFMEKEVEQKTMAEDTEDVEDVEDVEDAPSKPKQEVVKKGRGRPKGSLNKKGIKIVPEKPQAKPTTKLTIKPIKKLETSKAVPVASKEEKVDDEDQVVVMVGGKAVKGSTRNSFSPEIPDDERTRASIEALKQMEAEEEGENAEAKEFDENSLPIQDRMGNPATISVGKNKNEKVAMKNSFIPEAQQVKDAVKFIPLVDEETAKKINKKAKDAFIPLGDEDESEAKPKKDSSEDSFIEM